MLKNWLEIGQRESKLSREGRSKERARLKKLKLSENLAKDNGKFPAKSTKAIMWRTYNMTLTQISDMHHAQKGRCANPGCLAPILPYGRSRAIDHCHKTGAVRGMLCKSCNMALGLVCDSPKILNGLIEYLDGGGTTPKELLAKASKAYRKPKDQTESNPANPIKFDPFKNNS